MKGRRRSGRMHRRLNMSILAAVPHIGVVTENVLIPITKTIVTKKIKKTRCNIFEGKTDVVRARKGNENASIPLLKVPSYLSADAYGGNWSLHFKQRGRLNGGWKEEKSRTKLSRLSEGNSASPMLHSFNVNSSRRRIMSKRRKTLSFPCPISNLPKNVFSKRKSPSPDSGTVEQGKFGKGDKIEEEIAGKISRALTGASATSKAYKRSGSDKIDFDKNAIDFRLLSNAWQSNCLSAGVLTSNISNNGVGLLEHNISKNSVTITGTTAAIAVFKATSCTPKNFSVDSHCDCTLKSETIRRTLSKGIGNFEEKLKFPINCNETQRTTSDQVRLTAFDPLASHNCRESSATDPPPTDKCTDSWSTFDFPYSGQNIDRSSFFMLTEEKEQSVGCNERKFFKNEYPHKIKYSWQVLGTSSQTSRTLLESCLVKENDRTIETIYDCSVKYSWQIIGIATQTSITDFDVSKYQSNASLLVPKTNASFSHRHEKTTNQLPVTVRRNGKCFLLLNNQCTQTFAHKDSQTQFSELHR